MHGRWRNHQSTWVDSWSNKQSTEIVLSMVNVSGDMSHMIQVYNIVSGKLNNHPTVELNLSNVSNTRGNIYKMHSTLMHYNLCKHLFSNIIVAIWNSLPNTVVSAVY